MAKTRKTKEITYEQWFKRMERARKLGRPESFYRACVETGYNPQTTYETDLFQRGAIDSGITSFEQVRVRELRRNSNRNVSDVTYAEFLRRADGIGGVVDAAKMRRVLSDCFPRRFGCEGEQPLYLEDEKGRYVFEPDQIEKIFKKVIDYAKRRLKQK